MKNNYETRGEITAIFIKTRDGNTHETIIDTVNAVEKARKKKMPYSA